MKEQDKVGKEKIRLSKILYTEVHVFDNHQVPRKFRGQKLYLREKRTSPWEFASSGRDSKTGKHTIRATIKHGSHGVDDRLTLYLLPNSYSLKDISRADKGGVDT